MIPTTYTSDARRTERAYRPRVLRRLTNLDRVEIHAAYPGLWPADEAGERKLSRDLAALRTSKS